MKRKSNLGLVGIALVALMLTAAIGLNFLFCKNTAEEIYINSQRVSVIGTVRQIEYATDIGKPIEHFYGAVELLEQIISESNIVGVGIIGGDGVVLYKAPSEIDFSEYQMDADELFVGKNGQYYTELAISNDNRICLLLNSEPLDGMVGEHTKSTLLFCAVCVVAAGILLLFLSGNPKFNRKTVIVILFAAQLALGIFLIGMYRSTYYSFLDSTKETLEQVISADINHLAEYGILPVEYNNFDEYLADISARIPEIESLSSEMPPKEQDYIEVRLPYQITLYGCLNEALISRKIIDIAIETIVLATITVFITLEFLFFFEGGFSSGTVKRRKKATRMLFFVVYMGCSMSAAFVTIISYKMFLRLGSENELIVGLPATVEMLAGLTAIVLSGKAIEKFGYMRTMTFCIASCAVGAVLSGLSGNIWLFAAARSISGFGFTLVIMTGRLLSSAQKDSGARTDMLSMLTSSTMIGYCCGAVVGGLLSDRFSYSIVLFISAAVILLAILLLKMSGLDANDRCQSLSVKSMAGMMRSPDAIGYLLLIILPLYAGGMFISYSLPIFGTKNGLTVTMIAGLIMLNSLLAAYLAPFMSKSIQKLLGADVSVKVYGITLAVTLGFFSLMPGVPMLIASSAVLGIADSFGFVMAIEGFYARKPSHLGASDSMTSLTLSGKAGQSIAPALLSAAGGTPGFLAGVVAVGMILYMLISRIKPKSSEKSKTS